MKPLSWPARAAASAGVCLVAMLSGTSACAAAAPGFPAHPVRLVVPFAPGGGNDVFARLVAQGLSDAWKQQVVVENHPGAGGNVGTELVAKSEPDGYTLLLGHTGTLAINPSLYGNLDFSPRRDLAPIALVASTPLLLVVNPDTRVHSVAELITRARDQPGQFKFASSGSGTGSHLAGELFKRMANVQITHVPYKGTSPAVTDLLGGQVQMMFSVVPTALAYVQAGRLVGLGVTGRNRLALLPKVPTVAASGLPGFESTLSYGVLAPRGTPVAVITEINARLEKLRGTAAFRERLGAEGAEPLAGGPVQFAALIGVETEKWRKVIEASGAHAE